MRFGITGQHRSTLARGAAVLVVGGIAAGCSSGAASLNDGLVTNSTGSNAPVVVAQANQPYPGDTQSGRREQPRYGKIVRPQVPVGGATQSSSAPAALPSPSTPVYSAPAASQPTVSSQPLPPPTSTQGERSAPATASPQQAHREQQPAPNPPQPESQAAVLPQAPKPQEKSNGQTGNTSPSAGGSYTVTSGDTLYGIARKTGASVESIKRANSLSSGVIQIGQKLTIPSAGATVANAAPAKQEQPKAADPVTTAAAPPSKQEEEKSQVSAYTPPSDSKAGAAKEEESTEVAALTPDSTGVGRLRWPVRGRVVSNFSGGSSDGIDIAVPEGTSVRAAENGVVIYSGDGLKGFGNTVLVRHEDGLVTVYGHASDLKVKRGDNVKRGQEIALSGMSGQTDSPKLHFEVRKGTSPVDPMTYLE
ncbi:peptidoglycan DD-metalloendopeptidase family protein [Chelativorans salis]|uniref:Peptidoglycan DD-metalloendopeptidase family protein n=1 Tax=Chelativorans salis TaxID=2978478 RepID=A0ABT2LL74_9HYPH|nr:peptidoglycan DD-metalloendopeptidase family protein [Chelativorans sp. EGI FJ00035]MCT7375340.1 peptidoglycan DD-metalloendopeptidase family protein [Chelativorans sp. EGI FJ00035]